MAKVGEVIFIAAILLYIYNQIAAMDTKKKLTRNRKFDPKKSTKRAKSVKGKNRQWSITTTEKEFVWTNSIDKVKIIREGLPYESIEVIGKIADLPVKQLLRLFRIPQTTYNKKKRDKELMSGRDSEVILVLTELLDFGLSVFNHEKEKFQRWLKKPNVSIGGTTPASLFDSLTGIQEVRNSLNRLEYGNMA